MAAFDFHRKIIEDPPNAIICSTQCDPFQNLKAICTPFCSQESQLCPNVCTTTQPPQSPPPPPPPPPPPTGDYIPKHHHSSLSIPLKISLVILVLTFSLFLLYTLYKFYTVWYRSRTRRPPPSSSPPSGDEETVDEFVDHDVLDHPIWYIRTIGLQPSVISAITVVKYNKTDGLIEGTDCSVCLSDFEQDEMLRLLPKCNHAFHISCIDTWLRSHTNCPLCRAGIVKNTTTTTTTINSSSSDQNLDDSSGQIEETQMGISISDEVHGEDDDQGSELRIGVIDEEDLNDNNDKGEVVGGGGTSDFLIIRRSVSLNDYAACRVRSDVNNNNNNNCYYSDRHQVQIQPVEGDWELSRRDLEMI